MAKKDMSGGAGYIESCCMLGGGSGDDFKLVVHILCVPR